MRKIGEYIMYGGAVLRISGIGTIDFAPSDKEYYILESVVPSGASRTYVPKDNDKLVSMMRSVMSLGEIKETLDGYADIPASEWLPDNKARADMFRAVLESQNMRAIIAMMKSIDEMSKMRTAEGKKNYITDMNALARAKKILCSEISFVMGITELEAAELMQSSMSV